MNNRKELSFPLLIIAIVLGWTIFKQFDFAQMRFEQPFMAIIYGLTFLMTVYLLLKKDKKKEA